METTKQTIISLLLSTGREGMDKLIIYLDDNGFFTQPASTSSDKHCAKEGGLAEHSLNVYGVARNTFHMFYPSDNVNEMLIGITIAALLHDVGKIGQFGKAGYVENILKSGKRSESKPYETNKELLPIDHEIRSLQIISQFIELTEEESFAILYHNGMYGPLKYNLQGHETKLQMLIHFADMWTSRVIEKEDK